MYHFDIDGNQEAKALKKILWILRVLYEAYHSCYAFHFHDLSLVVVSQPTSQENESNSRNLHQRLAMRYFRDGVSNLRKKTSKI
ncbi:hypothetical protein DM860_018172 [Cuscuta australis]|uniref:Uncharacterized protein n=1 Tax=Cuscuta australis TaxID=267555 RepID=A0A328DJQ0_9ASTE|nr:hypothetical protein DM860_018172 [Cuscuta australis]